MKIAIQGLETSFHAIAARRLFGEQTELIFCDSFKDVFDALESHQADQAVVAIENSLYGSINNVYDLLLKHDFSITAEVYEEIGLHLLGLAGTKLIEVSDVYSHPAALGESTAFLDEELPKAERHEFSDTAAAAKQILEWGDSTKVAIANQLSAEAYGLEILAKNIETHQENYTRFIALSPTANPVEKADKTSITFQTPDVPGALHAALGVFVQAGANLSKLESRPIVGKAWQYMYYVDFNVDLQSSSGQQVMKQLPDHATNIRVLGSYKSGSHLKI